MRSINLMNLLNQKDPNKVEEKVLNSWNAERLLKGRKKNLNGFKI